MKPKVKIEKGDDSFEDIILLSKSIIQVSKASKKLLNSGLTKEAIIILLRASIGVHNVTKKQIELVIDHLPRLHQQYTQKIK